MARLDMKKTGRNIRKLKADSGLTVREIVAYLGLTNEAPFFRWQRGEAVPSLEHLLGLADLFHVGLEDIVARGERRGRVRGAVFPEDGE